MQTLLQWKSREYYIFRVLAFVDLVTQQAMRMRPITSSFVACLAVSHLQTLSHINGTILGGEKSYRTQDLHFDFYNNFLKRF